MSIEVELFDPRHDRPPEDLAAFAATEGLMPYWSYDLIGINAWNSWTPSLIGVVRMDSQIAGVICAMSLMPLLRHKFAPAHGGPVPRIVDVRQPFNGYWPPWHFARAVPQSDYGRLFAHFERAAIRRLGPSCMGVIYRQVMTAERQALGRRGLRLPRYCRAVLATTVMDVEWSDVDGWLKTLSKSRRGDLRRQVRRLREDNDLVVRFDFGRDDVDTLAVARLLIAHHLNYNDGRLRYPQPTSSYLDKMIRRPDVGILTYHNHAGRLLGYGTYMRGGSTDAIFGTWGAVRPEDGGRRHIYFDMYHRFMEQAIKDGRTRINAGRGMNEIKCDLGFREEPMYSVVAPRWVT